MENANRANNLDSANIDINVNVDTNGGNKV